MCEVILSQCSMPSLYECLTIVEAQHGNVRHFQLGMMYFLYAVFLGVLGRLGCVLGGAALSFAVVAIKSQLPGVSSIMNRALLYPNGRRRQRRAAPDFHSHQTKKNRQRKRPPGEHPCAQKHIRH